MASVLRARKTVIAQTPAKSSTVCIIIRMAGDGARGQLPSDLA
jgi:hypothetical protein